MADTAFQHLLNTATPLATTLATNNEVCSVLAGLLGKLVIECQAKGVPVNQVQLSDLRAQGNGQFMCRIKYFGGLVFPCGIGVKGSLEDYMANKGIQLAKVLAQNYSISRFFEALVTRLVEYAKTKGVPFSDLWVYNDGAFISRDDELVIRVGHGDRPYKLKE